jgi:hypothetical protein
MKPIRTHMSMFYDELWTDLTYNQSGKVVKPFQDRCKFSWTNPQKELSSGFVKQKPNAFYKIDQLMTDFFYYDVHMGTIYPFILNLIELSDNRMMMGDYRYGSILRQNLDNYDIVKEFYKRTNIAKETSNLEYVCDAYNMVRIQYFKSPNNIIIEKLLRDVELLILTAYNYNYPLVSIDDGIHAEEK